MGCKFLDRQDVTFLVLSPFSLVEVGEEDPVYVCHSMYGVCEAACVCMCMYDVCMSYNMYYWYMLHSHL